MAKPRTLRRLPLSLLLAALVMVPTAVRAHPHVWVTVHATVRYDHGAITALEQTWTFDEYYTAMAIQGLDVNNDGIYDRQELAELAQVNMDGLKEFAYFTYAKLGAKELSFGEPKDYWLSYENNILALHFILPLAEPVLAEAEGFNFSVYDPTYFIAFDFAKEDPVGIGEGAPSGCKAELSVPQKDAEDAQKLGEAFFNQLGGANFGISLAKTATVSCPKG